MKNKKEIPMGYIDLDGVLVDMISSCEKEFDVILNPWPKLGEFQISKVVNIPEKSIQAVFNTVEFLTKLKPYDYAYELVEFVENLIGKEDTYILTAPSRSSNCYKGKVEWVEKYFPKFIKEKRFLIGSCKHTTADSRSFLIDDNDLNINEYNKYGGKGILFPQEWNSAYSLADISLEIVKNDVIAWLKQKGTV